MPDLKRADFAKPQVSGKTRCVVEVGPISQTRISGNAVIEKSTQTGLSAGLAPSPAVTQASRPIRVGRLQLP